VPGNNIAFLVRPLDRQNMGIEKSGYLIFVLHSHLPYVRHPGYKPFLEENWLNEAILETYIPLIRSFRALKRDGVRFNITMSFTPPLISMLEDEYLQENFRKKIDELIYLANKEVKRTVYDPHLNYLSQVYLANFEDIKRIFLELDRNVINGFREFHQEGYLETITSPATHGFLPLMESEPSSVLAQIRVGRKMYRKTWGHDPRGIWLSECGYYPGLEKILADEGFRYFFADSHAVDHAIPRPKFGVYAPVEIGNGVFGFGRDEESSSQVWSAKEGYPGDFRYREYYRDIGFDLDYDYIKEHLHVETIRSNTGIKYHRITGKTDYKDYYHPDWAMEAAGNHADDFLRRRIAQCKILKERNGQPAIIVSPYDAELYGHWWYEGPKFLEFLFKKIHFNQNEVDTIHPMNVVALLHRIQSVKMDYSSWGENGYSDVWLNSTNDWIYRYLLSASIQMNEYSHKYKGTTNEMFRRTLNQMARELLLAQSSDWAFIMKTGTMVDYAVKRTKIHINLFNELENMIKNEEIDSERLTEIEGEHPIFPDIRFEDYV